ncbi:MAG: radical SAM protein [bacterium]|nr:radical SAM protein [bacterium]
MKVLLINPLQKNMITTCLPKYVEEEAGFYPPLGLALIAGYLQKQTNFKVEIIDALAEKLDLEEIANQVRQKSPEIVGITTTTFTLIDVLNIAQAVKEINKNIHVVLGGPHLSIYPGETLAQKDIDSVVIGEGEITFCELVRHLADEKPLNEIEGVGFKKEGKIIINQRREYIQNLDEIPFPARELLSLGKYYSIHGQKDRMTTIFTSRGCPYNCLFCYHAFGKKFRFRSPGNVVDELQEIMNLGIKEIFFFDDLFTAKKDFAMGICEEIIRRKLHLVWEIRARINTVDREILQRLKEAGCRRISYGVEAGTDKILKVLRKGITTQQVIEVFKLTKEVGFITYADFMIGSPTETRQEILETIRFAQKLAPDFVQFSITTPYPNTDLYQLGLEKKIFKEDFWLKFVQNPTKDFKPQIFNENLTYDELVDLLNYAYKGFYVRPKFILKRLLSIKSTKEFCRYARAGLRLIQNF